MSQRFVRFRNEGEGVISGNVLVYGDTAIDENGRLETFLPGSIVQHDPTLTVQHKREMIVARAGVGLHIKDSPTALTLRAKLPDTEYGRVAREMVDAGLLRGLSAEYLPYPGGEVIRGGEVTIRKAALVSVSLVDKPAYSQSVLLRNREMAIRKRQSGFFAEMEFGEPFVVSESNRRKMQIEPGALDLAPDGVFLLHGNYDRPLGNSAEGTLDVDLRRDGVSLRASNSELKKSPYWPDARKLMRAGLITGIVPGIVRVRSASYTDGDGYTVERIEEGVLCEGYLRARQGAAPVSAGRRRRRWLLL